jgi:hypothetical protein
MMAMIMMMMMMMMMMVVVAAAAAATTTTGKVSSSGMSAERSKTFRRHAIPKKERNAPDARLAASSKM